MKYFIGIDGGGTKTKCILVDENLKVVYQTTGGPSNFLSIGVEQVSITLVNLINECIKYNNINYDQLLSVVIGTAGAGRRSDAELLENSIQNLLANKKIKLNKLQIFSDAIIALEGAFSGKPGAILIIGTGSIMFGKDKNGNIHRVGGYGKIIGDESGGYYLGVKALNAVAKEFDGRGDNTLITKYISEQFSINSPDELITEIYKNNFDIASIAPLVIKAAENNDKIANEILALSIDEILLHILSMKKKMNEEVLNLSFIGSLLLTNNFYSRKTKEKILLNIDNIVIKDAENTPEFGAVLLAKKIIN